MSGGGPPGVPYNPNIQGGLSSMPDGGMQGWLGGFLQNSDQDLFERIWPLGQMSPFAWLLSKPPPRESGLMAKIIGFLKKLLGIGEKGKGFADIINDDYTPSTSGVSPMASPGGGGGVGIE